MKSWSGGGTLARSLSSIFVRLFNAINPVDTSIGWLVFAGRSYMLCHTYQLAVNSRRNFGAETLDKRNKLFIFAINRDCQARGILHWQVHTSLLLS